MQGCCITQLLSSTTPNNFIKTGDTMNEKETQQSIGVVSDLNNELDCGEDYEQTLFEIEGTLFKIVSKMNDVDIYLSEERTPYLMLFVNKNNEIIKKLNIYLGGSTYGGWIYKVEDAET